MYFYWIFPRNPEMHAHLLFKKLSQLKTLMLRLMLNNDITEYYIQATQEANLSQFTTWLRNSYLLEVVLVRRDKSSSFLFKGNHLLTFCFVSGTCKEF